MHHYQLYWAHATQWARVSKGRGKRDIPEKTRRAAASSGTIPTCENPVVQLGIEPGSPWREASLLIAQSPQPLLRRYEVVVVLPNFITFDPRACSPSRSRLPPIIMPIASRRPSGRPEHPIPAYRLPSRVRPTIICSAPGNLRTPALQMKTNCPTYRWSSQLQSAQIVHVMTYPKTICQISAKGQSTLHELQRPPSSDCRHQSLWWQIVETRAWLCCSQRPFAVELGESRTKTSTSVLDPHAGDGTAAVQSSPRGLAFSLIYRRALRSDRGGEPERLVFSPVASILLHPERAGSLIGSLFGTFSKTVQVEHPVPARMKRFKWLLTARPREPTRVIEVSVERRRSERAGGSEKTPIKPANRRHRPGTIPTSENLGATPPDIETGSPR
ncbi:hypothetical protein PR048_021848 [Dryococelus australis]|uniref:Uncharacterized protein n=1 Tax=Dryococelus australis TaxID=614101 RepID=A0ABQ9GZE2_9NEOP|nr:hypothetical protein PR048_021848 [Dryococelus australis]